MCSNLRGFLYFLHVAAESQRMRFIVKAHFLTQFLHVEGHKCKTAREPGQTLVQVCAAT